MNHLNIIKYISFRARKTNTIKIITLPDAIKEITELKEYHYDISKEKYFKYISKIYVYGSCIINTIFNEKYNGTIQYINNNILTIKSSKKISYKNTYYNSIGSTRRFEIMDI